MTENDYEALRDVVLTALEGKDRWIATSGRDSLLSFVVPLVRAALTRHGYTRQPAAPQPMPVEEEPEELQIAREAIEEQGWLDYRYAGWSRSLIPVITHLSHLTAAIAERDAEIGRLKACAETIDVLFDAPPGPESGRFIEVENEHRRSIRAGEWIDRGDGTWALRITRLRDGVGRDAKSCACPFCDNEVTWSFSVASGVYDRCTKCRMVWHREEVAYSPDPTSQAMEMQDDDEPPMPGEREDGRNVVLYKVPGQKTAEAGFIRSPHPRVTEGREELSAAEVWFALDSGDGLTQTTPAEWSHFVKTFPKPAPATIPTPEDYETEDAERKLDEDRYEGLELSKDSDWLEDLNRIFSAARPYGLPVGVVRNIRRALAYTGELEACVAVWKKLAMDKESRLNQIRVIANGQVGGE